MSNHMKSSIPGRESDNIPVNLHPPRESVPRRTKVSAQIAAAVRRLRAGTTRFAHGLLSLTHDSLSKTLVLVAAIALAVIGTFLVGLILRVVSPQSQITVSAFEIFAPDQKVNSQSGKAISDLLVDDLHSIVDHADRFSGNQFSSSKSFPLVPDMPHIPVETSYGIEIKGVSLDQLMATWSRIRYHEFLVSGDLMSGSDGDLVIMVRYVGEGRAKSFESQLASTDPAALENAVSTLALELVEDINPTAAARYSVGSALACRGDCKQLWDRSVRLCSDWAKRDPENPLSFFYLGYVLSLGKAHPSEAQAFLDRALELDPHLDLALNSKGVLLDGQGKYEEAKSMYSAALRMRKSPNPLMNTGFIAYEQGHYQDAVAYYQKALDVDPKHAGAYIALGEALLHLSRSADAADAYRRARYLSPQNYASLYGLVRSLANVGKSDEALRECEEAALLDPDAAEPLVAEGIVYLKTKQAGRAKQQFEASITKKNLWEAQVQIAMAYIGMSDLSSARTIFEKLLSLDPNDGRVHHLMAKVLEGQGDVEGSRSEAAESERLNPALKYTSVDEL